LDNGEMAQARETYVAGFQLMRQSTDLRGFVQELTNPERQPYDERTRRHGREPGYE
jgi:hypothetical protein